MKTSAGSGSETPQPPRKGRGSRTKAKASYVDESLFGSPAGHRTVGTEFDPPWVDNKARAPKPLLWSPESNSSKTSSLATTPRKRNKYRLKNHTPSYCDETLFGPKPGGQEWAASWTARCEVAKLRPLLWTPPSAPRDPPVLSSHPKEAPLRAVHRDTPRSQGQEGSGARYGEHAFRKQPKSCSDGVNQDVSRRLRSQSLTRLDGASDRLPSSAGKPRTSKPKEQLFPASSRGSPSEHSTKGLSGSLSARMTRAANAGKSRPPWK
nr:RBPJ-interacting and tubulin-associated protein 1 [Pogona vitticeps]